jgi:hypothetical protein
MLHHLASVVLTFLPSVSLLLQHASQALEDGDGRRGGTRNGTEGGGRGREEGRRESDGVTEVASSSNSSMNGPSSLTKENIYNREKGQKWVEMSEEDVRVLRRNILSSLQQCEEALNKCIVEVSYRYRLCVCCTTLYCTILYSRSIYQLLLNFPSINRLSGPDAVHILYSEEAGTR